MTQAKIIKLIVDTILVGSGSVLMIVGLIGLILPFLPGTSFIFIGLGCYEKSIPCMREKAYSRKFMNKMKEGYSYLTTFI